MGWLWRYRVFGPQIWAKPTNPHGYLFLFHQSPKDYFIVLELFSIEILTLYYRMVAEMVRSGFADFGAISGGHLACVAISLVKYVT